MGTTAATRGAPRWTIRTRVGLATCIAAGWVFAALYLRLSLPGVAWLAHVGFRAVTAPLAWLAEADPAVGAALVGTWLLLVAMNWRARGSDGVLWWVTCGLVAAAQILTIAVAALMERALAGGLVLALVVAARSGGLAGPEGTPDGPSRPARALSLALLGGVGVACIYYPFALVSSVPEGYPPLLALGRLLRAGRGGALLPAYASTIVVIGVVAWAVVARRGRSLRSLIGSLLVGSGAALAISSLLGDVGPRWTIPLVLASGLGVVAAFGSGRPDGSGPFDLRRWPPALLPACLAAAMLFSHAYAARVLRCPDAGQPPSLQALVALPEVFRVELSGGASRAVLSVRPEHSLAVLDLQPPDEQPDWVDGSGPSDPRGLHLPDTPEDLAWAGGDRFFAMHSARNPDDFDGEATPIPVRSVLVELDAGSRRVIHRTPFPGMCWTSCIEWSPEHRRLYLGCERPYGLHRWDPTTGELESAPEGQRLGDVESLAIDPDPSADRMFAVSLWRSPFLTELRASDLTIRRRTYLGGGNYVVAYDPATDRVFVTSYYGGRVQIVDGASLERIGSIPVGFGARAVAVDSRRGLVLASSTYEGVLTVADAATGDVLSTIPVGGHVKDIAVDAERGLAYFWSQCALYRLNLEELTGRTGRPL